MNIFLGGHGHFFGDSAIKKLETDGYTLRKYQLARTSIEAAINNAHIAIFCVEKATQVLEFLNIARACSSVPIIVVTKKMESDEAALILDYGADDCFALPLSHEEFVMRLHSLARRRTDLPKFTCSRVNVGDIRIDLVRNVVYGKEKIITLTKTEYKFLRHLAINHDTVVSKDELTPYVKSMSTEKQHHSVDMHVFNLRKKLSALVAIQTLPNMGFVVRE